jgi:hypothetical protein
MEYLIQISSNGQPIGHPISLANFTKTFGPLAGSAPPAGYAPFQKVQRPEVTRFETVSEVKYELQNGVVFEVWDVALMTEDQKAEAREFYRNEAYMDPSLFAFNEETGYYDPIYPTTNPGSTPDVVG